MDTHEAKLTIQQVAELTGLSIYTLRYYERIGLIHPIERIENTHRRYTMQDVSWIEFLTKLRATGMSIRQMQRYAELQREGEATLAERVEILKTLRCRLEAHMDEPHQHMRLISYKIEVYQEILSEKVLQ